MVLRMSLKRRGTGARHVLPACFLLLAMGLFGQSNGNSNAQPGLNNPIGSPSRYTLFPDQSVLAFTPGGPNAGSLDMRLFKTDGNTQLSLANAADLVNIPWDPDPIIASSGRILTSDHENVVYAQRSGSSVAVRFVDQPSTAATLLPVLADRLKQSTDLSPLRPAIWTKPPTLSTNITTKLL